MTALKLRLLRITGLALILGGMGCVSKSLQAQVDNPTAPFERSERQILMDLAMLNPDAEVRDLFKTGEKALPAIKMMQFQKQIIQSELNLLEHRSISFSQHIDALGHRIAELQNSIGKDLQAAANKDASFPMTDLETTDLLIRNCVVELQKLKWEIPAEEALAKQEPAAEKVRNLKQELQKVESHQKTCLELYRRLSEKGEGEGKGSALEDKVKLQLVEAQGKLTELELQRDSLKANLESLTADASADAVRKLDQLFRRQAVIEKQLATLRSHRAALLSVADSQAELKSMSQEVVEARRELNALRNQMDEKKVLNDFIEGTLQAVEKNRSAESKKSNDASPPPDKK